MTLRKAKTWYVLAHLHAELLCHLHGTPSIFSRVENIKILLNDLNILNRLIRIQTSKLSHWCCLIGWIILFFLIDHIEISALIRIIIRTAYPNFIQGASSEHFSFQFISFWLKIVVDLATVAAQFFCLFFLGGNCEGRVLGDVGKITGLSRDYFLYLEIVTKILFRLHLQVFH